MAYEFFYEGTPYSLEPNYGELFTGYRIPAGEIGAPTSIQTANQIQEVSNLLNQGIKPIELQPIQQEVFDQIPKQHFKEIGRLRKLTGAEMSMHAPIIEPSGITREGWSETDRESAERQLKTVIDKSHELNPDGKVPVTIHASAIQGTEFSPPSEESVQKYKEQIKEKTGREATKDELKNLYEKRIVAINRETHQMTPIERELRIYPEEVAEGLEKGKSIGEIKPEIRTPREEMRIHNISDWHNNLTQVIFYKNRGDEIIETYYPTVKKIWNEVMPQLAAKRITRNQFESFIKQLPDSQQAALSKVRGAYEYIENSQLILRSLFSKAYKYGSEEEKKILSEAAKDFGEKIRSPDIAVQSEAIQNLAIQMEAVKPNIYVPIEDFAVDNSAKTFANVALHAYEKYKDKAPIISIENLPSGMAFSRSEELKKLVEESREKFIIEAVKKGHSKSEAEEAAKKMIGVTWDVGHINMMRKEGFKEEDITKETEEIAKYVKHVHLTDNFGYSDSHLPPGMGNVPIKEILEKLEKAGFEGKKIVEAGSFVQHFKVPPTQAVLEAFGSPLYPMHAQPSWNQISATYGNYFSGYGTFLPESHFSMYGAGFSGMPVELGGQMQGKQSRFTGAPTE